MRTRPAFDKYQLMPLIPEEPQIHESAQGPRATPSSGRTAPPMQRTPRDVAAGKPGPSGPAASVASAASPQIQLIPASAEGALDAADEAVDLLLESGRSPGDVLVITTGRPHPWAEHELSFGDASYWAQHDAGDDVFYADAAVASRAASRPVVVVAVNGGPDTAAAVALPLAHARAGALLIVCGDPQQINAVLGTGV